MNHSVGNTYVLVTQASTHVLLRAPADAFYYSLEESEQKSAIIHLDSLDSPGFDKGDRAIVREIKMDRGN